jgi:hypothetical protein
MEVYIAVAVVVHILIEWEEQLLCILRVLMNLKISRLQIQLRMSDLEQASTEVLEVYASNKEGLVLCRCGQLITFLESEICTNP